jgi:hypothetical protein
VCDLCWKMLARTSGDAQPDPLITAIDVVGQRR